MQPNEVRLVIIGYRFPARACGENRDRRSGHVAPQLRPVNIFSNKNRDVRAIGLLYFAKIRLRVTIIGARWTQRAVYFAHEASDDSEMSFYVIGPRRGIIYLAAEHAFIGMYILIEHYTKFRDDEVAPFD